MCCSSGFISLFFTLGLSCVECKGTKSDGTREGINKITYTLGGKNLTRTIVYTICEFFFSPESLN